MRRLCFELDLEKDRDLIRQCWEWHAPAVASAAIAAAIRNAGVENFEIHLCGDRLFMIMDFSPALMSRAALSSPPGDWIDAWEGLFNSFQPPPPWAEAGERWTLSRRIYVLSDAERSDTDRGTQ